MWSGGLLLSIVAAAAPTWSAVQPAPPAECQSWQACRDDTEGALASESFDRALDLSWRAVQRGPKDDPALLILLARAQSMAGRPQDAIVTIQRLAERGVRTDAATNHELAAVRDLAGWAEVAPLVARADAGEPAPVAAPSVKPAARPAPAAARRRTTTVEAITAAPAANTAAPTANGTDTIEPAPLRFSTDRFVAAGLAYDAVSHRFVVGDQTNRKVRVIAEGLDRAIDLVRAESAGFLDVHALAIDSRRGDLWVATSAADGEGGALHRLQLVSGRPLSSFTLDGSGQPMFPVDIAVAGSGAVLVLDRDGRILRARAGATTAETVVQLDVRQASSLTLASADAVAYVAHAEGLIRVDLTARKTAKVSGSAEIPLAGIERLREHRGGLVALHRGEDGTRRLLRLALSRSGRTVRSATTYDVRFEDGNSPTACAVAGDELFLVSGGLENPGGAGASPSAIGPPADLVVRRVRLR